MFPTSALYWLAFVAIVHCKHIPGDSITFTLEDLHLSETADIGELSTKFLVKRASDAIVFLDDNAKETNYEFSYSTGDYEHSQKGMVKNGELSVVGAYTIRHPSGHTQTTMYVADKNGFHPMVQLRFGTDFLKSAVGR